ncbi:MAG: glucuronate isomerase, partial [Clostridia bacterium]|nr:glucuronate isomerase [Clostridia bacterium]
DELKAYMAERLDFFHENGCRVSDHGLDYIPYESGNAAAAFKKALKGKKISKKEIDAYATDMLLFFGKEYAARGWCMQIHVGAQRNNNTAMFEVLGPDTGYDTIGDCAEVVAPLARIMDTLEYADALPKTILYSLNSKDNPALATLCNAFQKAPYRSRIQLGSGWWFNDQKEGMIAQLKAFANTGVLGNFVGMLTDSRSFVSYPRHEYFRRILCNLIGQWVEDGEYPCDEEMLGNIIRGICYENAKSYFEL